MENNVMREELGAFFREHLMQMELLVFYGRCIVEDLVVVGPDGTEIGCIRRRAGADPAPPPAKAPERTEAAEAEDVRHTRDEAAHYLYCDVRQIDRWSKKGKIAKHRDADGKPYFLKSELKAFYKHRTGFDHP